MDKIFETLQTGQDTSNPVLKGFKEIENSGLDIKSNLYIAVTPNTSRNVVIDVIAKLDDGAKFEAFLKKHNAAVSIKSEGTEFKYAEVESAVVGWNKETVIAVAVEGGPSSGEAAAAKVELTRLFKLKENESANSIEGFKKLMKEKADMAAFVNLSSIYNLEQGAAAAMMMSSLKKLYEGAYYTATVNFENGKIVSEMKSYSSEALAKIMKKYDWNGVNLAMLEKYPSSNIDGFALLNFDLRMVGDIIKEAGMDGLVNMGMAQSGLSLEDVLKAFKGEIVAVASDFKTVKAVSEWDSTYSYNKTEIKWLVSLKVGDKTAFEKVMNSPMVQQAFTKQGDKYIMKEEMGAAGFSVYIDTKDVIVASDAALQAEYQAGKGKAVIAPEVLSEAKGSPAVMYVDLEKILASAPLNEMDAPEVESELKTLFKDIRMVSEKPSGSVSTSKFVLNFKKQDQNALVQMINFGLKAGKAIQAKQAAQRKMWEDISEDTTVADEAAVAVDTVVAVP